MANTIHDRISQMPIRGSLRERTLAVLKSLAQAEDAGTPWTSNSIIQDQLSISKATLHRHLRDLLDLGLIQKIERDGRNVTTIVEAKVSEWIAAGNQPKGPKQILTQKGALRAGREDLALALSIYETDGDNSAEWWDKYGEFSDRREVLRSLPAAVEVYRVAMAKLLETFTYKQIENAIDLMRGLSCGPNHKDLNYTDPQHPDYYGPKRYFPDAVRPIIGEEHDERDPSFDWCIYVHYNADGTAKTAQGYADALLACTPGMVADERAYTAMQAIYMHWVCRGAKDIHCRRLQSGRPVPAVEPFQQKLDATCLHIGGHCGR